LVFQQIDKPLCLCPWTGHNNAAMSKRGDVSSGKCLTLSHKGKPENVIGICVWRIAYGSLTTFALMNFDEQNR
jgi:hypothetical protein